MAASFPAKNNQQQAEKFNDEEPVHQVRRRCSTARAGLRTPEPSYVATGQLVIDWNRWRNIIISWGRHRHHGGPVEHRITRGRSPSDCRKHLRNPGTTIVESPEKHLPGSGHTIIIYRSRWGVITSRDRLNAGSTGRRDRDRLPT